MKLSPARALLAAGLLLALFFGTAQWLVLPWLNRSFEQRVLRELALPVANAEGQPLAGVEVEVSGLQVFLRGQVAEPVLRDEAQRRALNIFPLKLASNEITVPAQLQVIVRQDSLDFIDSWLSADDTVAGLRAMVERLRPDLVAKTRWLTLREETWVRPGVATAGDELPPAEGSAAWQVWTALREPARLEARRELNGRWILAGRLPDKSWRASVEARLDELQQQRGLRWAWNEEAGPRVGPQIYQMGKRAAAAAEVADCFADWLADERSRGLTWYGGVGGFFVLLRDELPTENDAELQQWRERAAALSGFAPEFALQVSLPETTTIP